MYNECECIREITQPYLYPSGIKDTLTKAHVVTGHSGVKRMCEHIKLYAWWKTLVKDVKKLCEFCQVCKQNKFYKAPQIPILQHPEVSAVWSKVHMDLIGPLPKSTKGHQYILTVIDAFRRFARCIPIENKKMYTVARAMVNEVFTVIGVPDILYSDCGIDFTGKDY